LSNNGKKNACRGVSPVWRVSVLCRAQSWPLSVSDCVGGCGAVSRPAIGHRPLALYRAGRFILAGISPGVLWAILARA
jgi:hypothetical protein